MAGLRALDETSGLATFGAGTTGPAVEAALAPHGLTLGHFPQSFEASTVGGWVVTRSAGQQSRGFGRIEDLFAGGHLETPRGPFDLPTHPGLGRRSGSPAARPRLRGPARHPDRRHRPRQRDAEARTVQRLPRPGLGRRARSSPGGSPGPACRSRWSASRRRSRPRRRSPSPARAARPASSGATSGSAGWVRSVAWRSSGSPAIRASSARRRRPSMTWSAAPRGIAGPGIGSAWRHGRFAAPYLRNALWDAGYAVDTLETATDWTTLPDLAAALGRTLRHGLEDVERARPRLQPPVARLPERVEPVRHVRLPPRAGPGRDARALADAQDRRQPRHRRARGDDQPPARRRHRPRAVPPGREGPARHGGAGGGHPDVRSRTAG